MAVCPDRNVVINAFRPPASSGFMAPLFRTFAAAAAVSVFGCVIKSIMSRMGPLASTAASRVEALAERILLSDCSAFFSFSAYLPLLSFMICRRTFLAVLFRAFFSTLGAPSCWGSVFSCRMTLASSSSVSICKML